jgi:hypothetical protein
MVAKLTPFRTVARWALLATLFCGRVALAQEPPVPAASPAPRQEETQKNVTAPCIEPPPLVRLEDYQGPFKKAVGIFTRKLERKSVHRPHYKPGAVLCSLELKDKFILFVEDTIDPATFLVVGFNAGLNQAQNTDPSYGQGAAGYGKRFGAEFAGQASGEFFKDFVYPSIFKEDPRYYRLAHGSGGKRFLHAVEHVFVAHREDGTHMFNFSEWLGTSSAVVLSNTYHPDNKRGFAPAAQRVGYGALWYVGFDVFREFWPEIARKLKLPFRGQHEPAPSDVKSGTP